MKKEKKEKKTSQFNQFKSLFFRGNVSQNNIKNLILDDSSMALKEMAKEARIPAIQVHLENERNLIGREHPLFPYYDYRIVDDGGRVCLESRPLSPEAVEKYPPRAQIRFSLPEKYRKYGTMQNLMQHAYGEQTEIEINVVEFRKMLGDTPDPTDTEAWKDCEWRIVPKKFPPPRPCSLVLEGSTYGYDYLMLGIERISEAEMIFSNHTQDIGLQIQIRYQVETKKIKVSASCTSESVDEMFHFLMFMKAAQNGCEITIKLLEEQKELITGNLNLSPGLGWSEDLQFMEMLKDIESIYGIKLNLLKKFSEKDLENIQLLYTAKSQRGLSCRVHSPIKMQATPEPEMKNHIQEVYDQITICYPTNIEIQDIVIPEVRISEEYSQLRLCNIEDLKRYIEDTGKCGKTIELVFESLTGEMKRLVRWESV